MTLGEYMDDDIPPQDWDLKGLSSWAMSRFGVNLSHSQLRKMTPQEVEQRLTAAAVERIEGADLNEIARYLEPDFAARSLAEWVLAKFDIEVDPASLDGEPGDVEQFLMERVQQVYGRREIEYPVEYALDVTLGEGDTENVYGLQRLAEWANRKYAVDLTPDKLQGRKVEDIRGELVSLSEQWLTGDRLERDVREHVGNDAGVETALRYARERFDTEMRPEDFDGDVTGRLIEAGRRFLRREMTELERYVLLQIYDSSWMDHLLAMDHLKGGIGLRSYAEQDPRVAYKREGARLFREMFGGIREKVTDMIFRVRLTPGARMRSVYNVSNQVHEQLSAYDQVTQQMDAQGPPQPADQQQKVQTITRETPKVGRNDPCPCGSGKKYKKCCGVNA
jgi:preprotein translocase subunit SecA